MGKILRDDKGRFLKGTSTSHWTGKKFSEEHKDAIRKGMIGKRNNWKGGRFVDKRGYAYIKMPFHPFAKKGGYVPEHRLVVENQIGRYLKPEEVVHHIGEKGNNWPEKLMAFVNDLAHRRFEKYGTVSSTEIIFDGRALPK